MREMDDPRHLVASLLGSTADAEQSRVAAGLQHRQPCPARVVGVPLCSRHVHLERVSDRPALRGIRVSRNANYCRVRRLAPADS